MLVSLRQLTKKMEKMEPNNSQDLGRCYYLDSEGFHKAGSVFPEDCYLEVVRDKEYVSIKINERISESEANMIVRVVADALAATFPGRFRDKKQAFVTNVVFGDGES